MEQAKLRPKIPRTWGIFFHDPRGLLATLEVKSLPCFPPMAISGRGSVQVTLDS